MQLRPYQIELVEKVKQSYKKGYRRPCIVLGCGGGKSCITAELAKRTTDKGNRVLFLVHRKELCDQIVRTFRQWGVNMKLCQIGMVQTITRRISKIKPPNLIITDENHHCLAKSYQRIYEAFPDARCVGVTATPIRLDGSGLGDINDLLLVGVSTKYLISNGFLAPYEYYAPPVADLTGLHSKNGEYDAKEVEKRLSNATIYGDVIRYYRELSDGKKAICYCATIEYSQRIAEMFCRNGITAQHIDGKTPKPERERIIQDFRDGKVTILCNVDLISEGFDVPDCQTVILLRPTKSLTLYIQQSMRCMRYQPGKTATIIDHVGNYARFGLPDADRKWELNPPKKKRGKIDLPEEQIRQCPICWFTFSWYDEKGKPVDICPQCGANLREEKEQEEKKKKINHDEDTKLEKITGFTLDFRRPEDCKSIKELSDYARTHGYKPGWVYYQGKQRGFIA